MIYLYSSSYNLSAGLTTLWFDIEMDPIENHEFW